MKTNECLSAYQDDVAVSGIVVMVGVVFDGIRPAGCTFRGRSLLSLQVPAEEGEETGVGVVVRAATATATTTASVTTSCLRWDGQANSLNGFQWAELKGEVTHDGHRAGSQFSNVLNGEPHFGVLCETVSPTEGNCGEEHGVGGPLEYIKNRVH